MDNITISKPRKPTWIRFRHLADFEEAMECGHTQKSALKCAGISAYDLDNASEDNGEACLLACLLDGNSPAAAAGAK